MKGLTHDKFQGILQNEYTAIQQDTNLILQAALFTMPLEPEAIITVGKKEEEKEDPVDKDKDDSSVIVR